MRISKVIARAGLCSRREAERWISVGRVSLKDGVIRDPALNVTLEDRVFVDGVIIPDCQPTRLWRYHKPPGLITSNNDPKGRKTVFDRLPRSLPRVISVGRLDINSEGLLLLTNDGDLARHLELPKVGWSRRYRVRVHGKIDQVRLESLKRGVNVSGVNYGPIDAILETKTGHNSWLIVSLREGKNREIRNVMAKLGLEVNRLIRVSFGPFQLGNLSRGSVEEVHSKSLRENLNIKTNRSRGTKRI